MIRFYVEWDCEPHERVDLFGKEIIEFDEDSLYQFWDYADNARFGRWCEDSDLPNPELFPYIYDDYYFGICELLTDITGYLVLDYVLLNKDPDEPESELETNFRRLWTENDKEAPQ